jgi:hypothetical protein
MRILLSRATLLLALFAAALAHAFDPFLYQKEDSLALPMDENGTATASNDFALIAIPDGAQLKLLLERFGVAAPVTQAVIEVHSAQRQAQAREVGDGVYVVNEPWLLESGKQALAFTVNANGVRDVLVMVLDAEQSGQAARREPKYGPRSGQ